MSLKYIFFEISLTQLAGPSNLLHHKREKILLHFIRMAVMEIIIKFWYQLYFMLRLMIFNNFVLEVKCNEYVILRRFTKNFL